MGRLNFILLLACTLTGFAVQSQTDSVIHLSEQQFIPGNYINFYVDNLNNIYLLNADNQVKKLNANGDSLAVSNALKKYGDVYSMDVSNSLKIIIYYKDFATIVVLDRFLKNVNTIDLRKFGILQAQAVAVSYDNNYWVFDEVENKLKKIDDNGRLLLSTPDLRTVFDESFMPETVTDYNNDVYLYSKKSGCKIFDYYGAFKQNIAAFNWGNVQVTKKMLYGFDSTTMHVYNIDVYKENAYFFHPQINNAVKFQKGIKNLYVLQTDGLHIYSID